MCYCVPAQWNVFVIACVFDIMQFDMLQNFFNCSCRGTRHYQRELPNLPVLGHLPAQSQQQKHYNKVWKMFKVKIKTSERHQLTSLRCLYFELYKHFITCLLLVLLTLSMQLFAGQLPPFCENM